jgi:hypothetical protein
MLLYSNAVQGPQWEAYRDIVTGVNGPHARPNTPVRLAKSHSAATKQSVLFLMLD